MRKATLFIGDIAILYISLYATLLVRYGADFNSYLNLHIKPFSLVFCIWLLIFFISNLYELGLTRNDLKFFRSLSYAITYNAVVSLAFFYFVPGFEITPKRNFFIFLAFIVFLMILWRWLFNYLLIKQGTGNNTLIIGVSEQSKELYDYLLENPQLGYRALGMLDVKDESATKILERLVLQKNIKTLVLDKSVYDIPDIINILYGLLALNINFYGLAGFFESISGKIPLGAIDQEWFLNNLSEGRKSFYEFAKRGMDISIAIILGAIAMIILPFAAIAIKISSPGPIFFKQKRVGKSGKTFTLFKFRSMIANSPDGSAEGKTGPTWAQENDPRITRIGNFLRKTRVDELPQLWSVLKGDMSLVGPRAERPEFHERLKQVIPFYEERYLIKPGLSGWTQIKYHYASSIKDSEEKLKYDLYYIKNRSLMLDIGIILKTINIVIRKEGR